MCSLFYHLQQILLLHSTFTYFNVISQVSYAQYQYTSGFDYRRRPSHLIINSIKRLRPLKAAGVTSETLEQRQAKQLSKMMNTLETENFRHRLQNALDEIYARSSAQATPHISTQLSEAQNASPRAISPILLVPNDDNEKEEQPVIVQPTLRPLITATSTPPASTSRTTLPVRTTTPILLSRVPSVMETDAARRARIQARWRKLGPLVKSVQYPYIRRNLHRIVIADTEAIRISDAVRRIVEQRLRQVAEQRATERANFTVEERPRTSGTLLSNSEAEQYQYVNSVDEQPVEKVEPSTSTVPTTITTTSLVSVNEFDAKTATTTVEFATDGTNFINTTPTPAIATTVSADASSAATSQPVDVSNATTTEPRPFLLTTPSSDYHFRRITPAKKFKFTQKLRRQPRLRIRKPGDSPGHLRGNQTASGRQPLVLPHLAPIHLRNDAGQTQLDNNGAGFSSSSSNRFDGSSNFNSPSGFSSSDGPASSSALVETEASGLGLGNGEMTSDTSGLTKFGDSKPPPVDFGQTSINVFGSGGDTQPQQQLPSMKDSGRSIVLSETSKEVPEKTDMHVPAGTKSLIFSQEPAGHVATHPSLSSSISQESEIVIPKNSGLLPASPPPDFDGVFGTGVRELPFGGTFDVAPSQATSENNQIEESIFTGDSALTPNRAGPTGDGLGPPILPGAAIPPPVPAVGIGGAAAGILPAPSPFDLFPTTQNPPTTLKPSALLSVLNKADIGFNQAINHFEQGTPVESAAIDILEVALGSEKLDSQAKLLGHIDRTIGIDNLQRLQRWANTGGALDAIKEQLLKIAKNYDPPENLLPTLPPQLQYLLAPSGKR